MSQAVEKYWIKNGAESAPTSDFDDCSARTLNVATNKSITIPMRVPFKGLNTNLTHHSEFYRGSTLD